MPFLPPRELSSAEIELVGYLMKYYNHDDADYIITKLVINGWPIKDYSKAIKCIKFDKFCHHYAIGKQCQTYACKFDRIHGDDFVIARLYNNGNKNVSIGRKRKAFYLAYYLYKYCNFGYSKDYSPILKKFEEKFSKDVDYPRLTIKYNNNWFINRNSINNGYIDNWNTFTHYEQYEKTSEYTYNSNCTNDTKETIVSLFSNEFYEDWEDVMEIGCNETEFYFSI